jgi:hypothetical protein
VTTAAAEQHVRHGNNGHDRPKVAGDPQFGKVPYEVVDSGAIANMNRSDLAVYLVIVGSTG